MNFAITIVYNTAEDVNLVVACITDAIASVHIIITNVVLAIARVDFVVSLTIIVIACMKDVITNSVFMGASDFIDCRCDLSNRRCGRCHIACAPDDATDKFLLLRRKPAHYLGGLS